MDNEVTLELTDLINIVKKRMKLIMVITVMATLVAGLVSFYGITPIYEAKTSIIIGKTGEEKNDKVQYNDVLMYQNLMKTYSVIAQSKVVVEKTIKEVQTKESIEEFKKRITVAPEQNTQILTMKLQGKDSSEVAKSVDVMAKVFIEESKRIYPGGNIQIMDKADVPEKPIKPNKTLNVAIAFLLGLMVSVGISFLLEYMDTTIKTEADIEKYVGLPVIGIIPKKLEE